MSLRTDLGIHEEAIEQAEAPRQRVMVRGDGDVGEIDEARVAIAFFHVSEHLIIGAVLFDDVDDVAERRIAPRHGLLLPVIRGGDALREASQLRLASGMRGARAVCRSTVRVRTPWASQTANL